MTRDPANTEWTSSLAIARRNVGRDLAAAGRWDDASAAYAESLDVFESLVSTDPDRLRFRRRLAGTRLSAGHALLERGDADGAGERVRSALALLGEIRAADAEDQQALAWMAEAHLLEGDVHAAAAHADPAPTGRDAAATDAAGREAAGMEAARAAWTRALETTLEAPGTLHPPELRGTRTLALARLGEGGRAAALTDSLEVIGYAAPGLPGIPRGRRR